LLPDFKKDEINILEPSAGCGNFLLPLFKKYSEIKKVNLYINDINCHMLMALKTLLKKYHKPKNFNLIFINKDFIHYRFQFKFDLIVGNPPFLKITNEQSKATNSSNLFELFWKQSIPHSEFTILISPKILLQSPTYKNFRKYMCGQNITDIIDFGEFGFKGVKIETIVIKTYNVSTFSNLIKIYSLPRNEYITQRKDYIMHEILPYWIIYRNEKFDDVYFKMKKDIFSINKNYELSNYLTSKSKQSV
jgi:DNA (cytosine-5)-methyltransferase 1